MTRRTLLNYEKWCLIPEAERGGGGPGGRFANYRIATVPMAFAAWRLMHGKYTDENLTAVIDGSFPRISPEFISIITKQLNILVDDRRLLKEDDIYSDQELRDEIKCLIDKIEDMVLRGTVAEGNEVIKSSVLRAFLTFVLHVWIEAYYYAFNFIIKCAPIFSRACAERECDKKQFLREHMPQLRI